MRHSSRFLILPGLVMSLLLSHSTTLLADVAKPLSDSKNPTHQAWSFDKHLKIDPLNISGVVVSGDFIALATDEGSSIELYRKRNGVWHAYKVVPLSDSVDELDLEGLAWQAPYLYATGSYGLKRKKLKDDLNQKDNLKRLQPIELETSRQQLFRIELDNDFNPKEIQTLSLADIVKDDPILKPFSGLPSKENGVDIEGLAVSPQGELILGLRGPLLRGNLVPLLRVTLAKKSFKVKEVTPLYLELQGRGIRGLSETPNGYLVLAGATGDQPLPYQVYHWSGENGLPGTDRKANTLRHLCELPEGAGKPEGIQFLAQAAQHIEFLIVQDGLKDGQPTAFSCAM
ncbi:DUF3616 domain-containing protein [Thiomicrorhabdus aquaedulcis]|uniref:DUF3616 domain-containing protein n=1 Tax=Thiomicrorhabdus aquaedulcis TaxID=2211106 RepID=UPI000FDA6582|nr:DUF3616 domain-containing protein [Thiomicrorhabdus aquaedulcis]